MNSDFLTDGYADSHELQKLEQKLTDLHAELVGASEHSRGRTHKEIEQEIVETEEQKRLLLEKLNQ